MKIVYSLYRVSTKKQVDKEKNDIPMQRQACNDFARQHGWTISKEFEEKGISGFKVSAENRDAIQDLKIAAGKKEFDILLVFMFDRLGRIDDETPFVVEWFAKQGIEIWSVMEGQQCFDNHVDKLTNYIRFWQASGESEKTSMRISTRMQQLKLEGCYTGGLVPYGYCLVKNGTINKQGKEMSNFAIDPVEAEIVRSIFHKTICDGYGSHRLATYLNKQGYRTHKNSEFKNKTVTCILKNSMYYGCLPTGETSSQLQNLKIISKEEFDLAQEILKARDVKQEEKRQIALSTKGKGMLSGNIYCAHCGSTITTIRYKDSYVRKDGSVYSVDQIKYCCYHKSRKLCNCDGQTTYLADRVDEVVRQLIHQIFSDIKGAPEEDRLQKIYQSQMAGNRATQIKLGVQIKKDKKQLELLQLEIGKSLTGDSAYSPDDLSQAIKVLKERIINADSKLIELVVEEEQKRNSMSMITPAYRKFKSWADEFDTATLEQQKMIACQLFKRIELGRDYKINVELDMTYQEFCTDWQPKSLEKVTPLFLKVGEEVAS